MSSHISNVRPDPDKVLVDIVDYVTKYKVTSRNKLNNDTLFLVELEYGGTFLIEGVADEQLHPFLMIECPRLLFPYVRRIIADMTREGGFPAVSLEPVDFVSLYRQQVAMRAQAQEAVPAEKAN